MCQPVRSGDSRFGRCTVRVCRGGGAGRRWGRGEGANGLRDERKRGGGDGVGAGRGRVGAPRAQRSRACRTASSRTAC
eukprot:4632594-Pleurochrysis_carterae.AAC.1